MNLETVRDTEAAPALAGEERVSATKKRRTKRMRFSAGPPKRRLRRDRKKEVHLPTTNPPQTPRAC